jgi:hypothetical protein
MRGKSLPLPWLHILLKRTAPRGTPCQVVHMDLGGETGKNPDVQELMLKHNYIVQPMGAMASSQNGSGERPHQTIGNAIRAMLYSAGFLHRYWEYAFYFYLRIHAVLPHGESPITPYHKVLV